MSDSSDLPLAESLIREQPSSPKPMAEGGKARRRSKSRGKGKSKGKKKSKSPRRKSKSPRRKH